MCCCYSIAKSCPTFGDPRTEVPQASLSFIISQSLLKLTPIELVIPSNPLILCHPFSFCLHSLPASGSFPVSHLFASGSQSNGAAASASVLPMNIQGWFPSGLTGLISLLSKGLSRVFSNTTVQKHQFFGTQPSFFLWVQLSYLYMTTGKTIALTIWTFVNKVMSLFFKTLLPRYVIAFLPSSKHLLTSWFIHEISFMIY